MNFLFDVSLRPFDETHRVKFCDKNVSLFLIVRRKMTCLLISLKSEFIWPPRSPNLNPLNFVSLVLYERLNQERIPATISQMNEQVKEIIKSIPAEILQRVIAEFNCRIWNRPFRSMPCELSLHNSFKKISVASFSVGS